MYGLVNKAVEQFVIETQGEEVWKQIKTKAGIETEHFSTMHSYDDSITYSLVGTASELLNIDATVILIEFGKFWIKFAKKQGYGHYFTLGGGDLYQFLKNLDRMHSNIEKTYIELTPPSFKCTKLESGQLYLQYFSPRTGLEPFVEGLLYGLGDHFKIQLSVKHDKENNQSEGEVFIIDFI